MVRVLLAAVEFSPWVKVGGLGDQTSTLARALARRDCDVTVMLPLSSPARARLAAELVHRRVDFTWSFAGRKRRSTLVVPAVEGPRVVFIEDAALFETCDSPYGEEAGADGIGDLKHIAFSAALHPACKALDLAPDVLHLHDWHVAAAAPLWRTDHFDDATTTDTAIVLTVHNAEHQGRRPAAAWIRAGLREDLLCDWCLLHDGALNPLKGGLLFADRLTTVSPTHAAELVSKRGFGLEGVFESRSEHLAGILNAIDFDDWNPATDGALTHVFSAADREARARSRTALLRELGLSPSAGPIFAFVGRFSVQKGVDHVLEALPRLLEMRGARVVLLGTGDPDLESRARALEDGRNVAVRIAFDDALARRIYAGSDFVLMPSRNEPCGLVQMIAHRYGALPIVRSVGGLVDSVRAFGRHDESTADGFAYEGDDAESLVVAARAAARTWRKSVRRERLIANAMSLPDRSGVMAAAYVAVYEAAMAAREAREREDELLSHLRVEPGAPPLPRHRPIPSYFEKDVVFLAVQGPRRIWTHWEVQGAKGKAILDALDEAERFASRWELRVRASDGTMRILPVEGLAKNWFIDAEPATRYLVELWMQAGKHSPVLMGRSREVETPREIGR